MPTLSHFASLAVYREGAAMGDRPSIPSASNQTKRLKMFKIPGFQFYVPILYIPNFQYYKETWIKNSEIPGFQFLVQIL